MFLTVLRFVYYIKGAENFIHQIFIETNKTLTQVFSKGAICENL